MDVEILRDPAEFAVRVQPFLEADPYSTSVLGVVLKNVVAGQISADDAIWVLASDEAGTVVGAAMETPPHNLFLPRMGGAVAEAIARAVAEAGRRPGGVTAELDTMGRFLPVWQELTGEQSTLRNAMRLYLLGTLQPPSGVSGGTRLAEDGDVGLVAAWFDAFIAESNPTAPHDDSDEFARRRVALGQMWLWEDGGEIVSCAGVSSAVGGVARVGPVYTPPERRRRGYGAAVTAQASRAALDGGAEHVVLYTDLANPTSNAIYQSIGYAPHHDAEDRDFVR